MRNRVSRFLNLVFHCVATIMKINIIVIGVGKLIITIYIMCKDEKDMVVELCGDLFFLMLLN